MTNYHRHDMLNSSRNCNTIIRIYVLQSRFFSLAPSYLRTYKHFNVQKKSIGIRHLGRGSIHTAVVYIFCDAFCCCHLIFLSLRFSRRSIMLVNNFEITLFKRPNQISPEGWISNQVSNWQKIIFDLFLIKSFKRLSFPGDEWKRPMPIF